MEEAARLTRRAHWLPRTVLSYGHHLYVIFLPTGFLGYLGIRMLLACVFDPGVKPITGAAGACLAAIPFAPGAFIIRDARGERRARRVESGPMRFALTEGGISVVDSEGAYFFEPWTGFAGFHVASRVIVLPKWNSRVYLRIPIETRSGERRQEIQALLSGHLPELGADAGTFRMWRKGRAG